MTARQFIGIALMLVCAVTLVAWILQGSAESEVDMFIRTFVSGLLAGGIGLLWLLMVRKRPDRPE